MPRALTSQKIPPLTDTRSLGQRAWLDEAACATMPVDQSDRLFFPTGTQGRANDAIWDYARAICEGRPVRNACLADAMKAEHGAGASRFGFVGGKTPDERQRLAANDQRNQRRATGYSPHTRRLVTDDEPRQMIRSYRAGASTVAIGKELERRPDTVIGVLRRAGVEIRPANNLVQKECGTAAAYRRHLRNGEKPCDACTEAKRVSQRRERKVAS